MTDTVKFIVEVVGAVGALAGGVGACWAAWSARSIASRASQDQSKREEKAEKQEQERMRRATIDRYDDAIARLNQFTPEFVSRVRSLKRRHQREGGVATTTDIHELAQLLKDNLLNALGKRLTEEKNSLLALPISIVNDWQNARQQADEGMREAMTVISTCQHKLSEFEDDLEDKIARRTLNGMSTIPADEGGS